ncbi:MAG TPA: hypothetical protein VF528_02930 [Pyrinomonadaceae bacterium]|jgi:hypothetical protein
MKKLYYMTLLALLMMSASSAAFGQRPRVADDTPTTTPQQQQDASAKPQPTPPPAPKFAKAKYMGGYFGLKQKQEGSLSFDDRNQRLVFRDKQEREVISLSYDAVLATFADSEERRALGPGAQTAVGAAGILGLPTLLFKKKFEYLTIQYKDPDTGVDGTTQFKMKDKELVRSMAHTLADKAGLAQRGQVYVRRKDAPTRSENKETEP